MFSRGRGGAYYEADGDLDAIWKGKSSKGEWFVERDELCNDVDDWGGERCYMFYRVGNEIWTCATTTGKLEKIEVVKGNKL